MGVIIPFLDMGSGVPLHLQLERQMRQLIALGLWPPGAAVPSVRGLAARLVVNPNTVARVYRLLESQGILATVPGGGTFVAQILPEELRSEALRQLLPSVRHLARVGLQLGFDKAEVVAALEREWAALQPPGREEGADE